MAVHSSAPPPSSGGLTYAIVGLVLVAATIAMFFLFDCGKEEPAPVIDAGKPIERSTALAEEDFSISTLEEVDAGYDAGAEEPEEAPKKTVRRQVACNGSLDPAAIRSVVARNRAQVRSCYERALKTNNLLQGRLNVRLTVGTGGKVAHVAIGGTLRDPSVSRCVRNLASQWSFPSPTGGCVMVDVPFSLTPRN